MSKVLNVKDTNFETEVMDSDLPVLIDFSAEWCGPCKQLAPIIEELAVEYEGKIKVGTIDVGTSQQTATRFGVLSVPTILIFKNGKVQDQLGGAVPKNTLVTRIERLL